MTTIIEDRELNEELQELYLKSKQWISDLEFIHTDIEFLKTLFGRSFSPLIKKDDFESIAEVLISAANVEKAIAGLKTKIAAYLHNLEPLIVETNHRFEISIIETYSDLESRHNKILQDYQIVKAEVFSLTKQSLREKEAIASRL